MVAYYSALMPEFLQDEVDFHFLQIYDH